MKLKKGSAAAKAYMAKIRAKRKKVKKSTIAKPKRAARKVVKAARKKAAKKMTSIHKDTASHNVRISVVSGVNPYVQKLNKGITQLQKEITAITKEIKVTKSPLFKKSLVNRKKFLMSELSVGKQMIKKF
jgi:hypothetical protein